MSGAGKLATLHPTEGTVCSKPTARHSMDAGGYHHVQVALLSPQLYPPPQRKNYWSLLKRKPNGPQNLYGLWKKEKISCLCWELTAGSSRPWPCRHYSRLQNREYEMCVTSAAVGALWTAQYRLTYLLVLLSTVKRDRLLKSITGLIPARVSQMATLYF